MKTIQEKVSSLDKIILISLLASPITFTKRLYADAQESLFDSGNITRILTAALCIGLVFFLSSLKKYKSLEGLSSSFKYMFLYWFISIISLINTVWVGYSLVKYIEYFVLICAVFYIVNRSKKVPQIITFAFDFSLKFIEFLLLTVLVGLILSPEQAFIRPDSASNPLFNSIIPIMLRGYLIPLSNTDVGFFSGILLYVYIVDWTVKIKEKNKLINYIKIIIVGTFLVLGQSRMALATFFIVFIWYFFALNKKLLYKILLSLFIVCCLLLFNNTVIEFLSRGQTSETIFTLTGRTKWWMHALTVFREANLLNQLFGFGFAAGEKAVAAQSSSLMYTLDSEFFADLISSGLFGLMNITLMIITALRQVYILRKRTYSNLLNKGESNYLAKTSGIIIMLAIRCFTVTTFSLLSVYLIIFIFATLINHRIIRNTNFPNKGGIK